MKNPSSPEIHIMDIQDRFIKSRQAISFLADQARDEDLCGMLMLIQESMEVTEQMFQVVISEVLEVETTSLQG